MNSKEAKMRGRIVGLCSPIALVGLPSLLAFLCAGAAVADNTWIKTYGWDEVPPQAILEIISEIHPLQTGDALVMGQTESHGFGDDDGWIAKLDAMGEILWQRVIGTTDSEVIYSCLPINQGGFLLGGIITRVDSYRDLWLIKISEAGDLEWQKSFGGTSADSLVDMKLDQDGNVLVAARTASFDAFYGDTWVLKLNSAGNIIWEHLLRVDDYPDGPSSLIATSDGGALIVGFCYETYPYVLKLDAQGYIQWQKVLMGVYGIAKAAIQIEDGGYVIGGDGNFSTGTETDIWIMKLNPFGEIQWQKAYGGDNTDSMISIIQAFNGDIIFAGNSFSLSVGDNYDLWICQIDGSGNLVWQRRIGNDGTEYGRSISLTNANGVMIGGWLHDPLGLFYMFLAKLDFQGQLEAPCDYLADAHLKAREIFLTAYDSVAYVEESKAMVQVPEVMIQLHGAQTFTLCGDDGRILHLPAAASTAGAFGTKWRTEAMLINPSQAPLKYTLYYTSAGQNGLQDFIPRTGTLQAREGVLVADLLKDAIGLEGQAGSARVVADGPMRAFTRTFNDLGGLGTYGQGIPLLERSTAIPLGGKGHMTGIRSDDDFRTNIGFQEVHSLPTQVRIRFYDPAGSLLAEGETFVPAYSWVQYPVSEWGLGSVEAARAEVEVLSGGAVLAYASVADNRTGDPVFIPAEPEGAGEGSAHQVIPIIARTEGAYNTHWCTDLWLFNPTPEQETINLAFYTTDSAYTTSLILGPGQFQRIEDPIGILFPQIEGDAFGSLHIITTGEIQAWSRIYHDGGVLGTYGQSVPCTGEGELLNTGSTALLLAARNTAEYRTNVGFADFDGVGAEVRARTYDLQGNTLGETQFTVPPFKNIQVNLFDSLGVAATVEGAWVEVEVLSGGPVMPYLSVADNRTGDAVFIAAIS